jgi:1-acyl-sn-glycerol-3-phosphate acyltransferase
VGVRVEITGAEALAAGEGPYVFVCNHMSAMETQVLPGIIGLARPLTFVTKGSLMRYPVFSRVLGAFDPIVVSRTDPRSDLRHVLEMGKSKLEAGISVIIFPQARRTDDFDPEAFGTMGLRLARAAGVPMVPIALRTGAWGRGRWVEDLGMIDPTKTVRFAIGAPIPVGDDGPAAHRAVAAFIAERVTTWDQPYKGDQP